MKKYVLIVAYLILFAPIKIYGQSLIVEFNPDALGPYWYGQSVTFNYAYKVGSDYIALPPGCSQSFSVLANSGGTTNTSGVSGENINVVWGPGKSTTARLNVNLTLCNNSSYNGNRASPNYTVLSITAETPAMITNSLGSNNIPVCQSTPVTFSTEPMQIPNGVGLAADGYQWTIPAGWKFSDGTVSTGLPRLYQNVSAFTQQFTPDCKGGGTI
jgi:hypothetical protein